MLIEKRAAGMRRRCEKSESYEKDREEDREGREEDIDILSERGEHELISLD